MRTDPKSAVNLLAEAVESHGAIVQIAPAVEAAAAMILAAYQAGCKVMFCGNGGSAADAQHLAAEFLGRYLKERSPWPAMALTANSSAITAIGNDYGFDQVFARQLRGLAQAGDVLVGLSTSGKSANVVEAFKAAPSLGVKTIALTGAQPSPMSDLADIAIRVPSSHTPRIQEMHITAGHTICEIVETALVNEQG